MKKIIVRFVLVAIVAGGGWYGYWKVKNMPQRQQQVATALVRKGDVVIRTYSRGELRAVRSSTLVTPNLFSAVQVTRLAPLGSLAHEKDLIVEFDDSERRAALEEAELEVEQIDEQVKKARADLDTRDNQDKVDLLKARYAVRRSELEVKRNELISAIDARKNILNLEEAKRRLKQLESDVNSRQEQALAELAVYREKRNKALIDVSREKQRIAQSKVLSPMTGLVSIKQNRSSVMFFGQTMPDIREGDTLQPGMPVADVLDLSELEVVAKVGELDRANLVEGQDVIVQLDAVPDKKFKGKIKGMSGTASSNVFGGDVAKKFDVIFSLDMKTLLSELGATPEQVKRIMETAEKNAKKAPLASAAGMGFGGPGGGMGGPGGPGGGMGGGQQGGAPGGMMMAGGGQQGGAPGGPGGQAFGGGAPGGGGFQRGGAGGGAMGGAMANMSEADRTKFREAMQKELGGKSMQDLTPEERTKLFEKLRASMPAGTGAPGAPGAKPVPGAKPADGAKPAEGQQSAEGGRGGRRGGPGGPGGPGGFPGMGGFPTQDSEADRAKAKLPPAPEEDAQLEALLRPGLLADVEIIVEKIPDAIHVPVQAVFEKEGKQVVYVKVGARFEERRVKLSKRSESAMVISEGVKPGDIVAMADPFAKKSDKNDKTKGGGSGAGMPGMPSGGGKGGA
ncbi:MAG: HlyD family efflux transporter periplasmic adaptor subunit [Bryobacterales bacterium]|nr:HlyD family efflux transporter periplasmic adaptor subunit [Bryobacterales bacterium]